MVSLVGLAGVGKTALALAVAHAVAGRAPGGVAGVLVGEGSDAADVLAAVGGRARRRPARRTSPPGSPAARRCC